MSAVLFVCHANLCRSPMAEYIARAVLAADDVGVGSAGTHAVPGRPMHPFAAAVLAGRDPDSAGFRSREVSRDLLSDAALILTASRRERAFCVTLAPGAVGRTFTLRQFSRLAAAAEPVRLTATMEPVPGPGNRPRHGNSNSTGTGTGTGTTVALAAAVAAATRVRGRLQPVVPDADDLADPIGGTPADFRRCAREIEAAMLPIAALIAATG